MDDPAEKNDHKTNLSSLEEHDIEALIQRVRKGVSASDFREFVKQSPFSFAEWAQSLHTETPYLQRVDQEFGPFHSEKILELVLLLKKGIEVFEDKEIFYNWLKTPHKALDGVKPITLIDNTFGIMHVKTALTKIEHGILA